MRREMRSKDGLDPNRGKHVSLLTLKHAHVCLGGGGFTNMDLEI